MQRPSRKPQSHPTTPQTTAPDLRPKKAEVEELVQKISDLISGSPDKAAKVLEKWISESELPKRKKAG
ncbi:MAG: hypothetical protein RJB38_2140 [Pseudomonadota bacterium]|jgi:flagellar biosynthesis/type III secretory pathway M-ring protein FliF/YscJ